MYIYIPPPPLQARDLSGFRLRLPAAPPGHGLCLCILHFPRHLCLFAHLFAARRARVGISLRL